MPDRENTWYKLDNSAIVYTATQRKDYANVFRLALYMREVIDPVRLQEAFNLTLPRFPLFAVRIRRGFFWGYLEPNSKPCPPVMRDIFEPCLPFSRLENNGYPVRVLYYQKRLSVEFFHALTDGYGASVFLRTLAAVYLRLGGVDIPNGDGILDISASPLPGEWEDAYFRYGNARRVMKIDAQRAYQNIGTPLPASQNTHVISGIMPLDKLLALAKQNGVTLTEYLTALLLDILYHKQKQESPHKPKPLRVGVPVNCRRLFPSATLRNFILMVSPFIDPAMGDYTFEEILSDVKRFMYYYVNPKFLRAQMTGNIKTETNLLIRPVPFFIKRRVVAAFYKRIGDQQVSARLTNPGRFTLPDAMKPYVERAEVLMGRPFSYTVSCGLYSCGNTATISFNSKIQETDIERAFFRRLVRAGIPVKIESNRFSDGFQVLIEEEKENGKEGK